MEKGIFNNVKEGDIVYKLTPEGFIKGKVTGINNYPQIKYQIMVQFDNGETNLYNYDGQCSLNGSIELFWRPFLLPVKDDEKTKRITTGYVIANLKDNYLISQIYKSRAIAEEVIKLLNPEYFAVVEAKIEF